MKQKANIIQFEAATAVIEYNITEAGLAELRKKCTGLKAFDKAGYKAITQALSEIRGLRTDIEKCRVEYKSDALEYGRRIDAEAKRVTALILEIENPLKTEKDNYDAEQARIKTEAERIEQERIYGIVDRIERIKNAPLKHQGKNIEQLSQVIEEYSSAVLNDNFAYGEFSEQALIAKEITKIRLQELLDFKIQQEAESLRLAEERLKFEEEKAVFEAQKAKEIQIQVQTPAEILQELEDTSPWQQGLKFQEERNKSENSLANKIANVVRAQNDIFPLGRPTYLELIGIIEKMVLSFPCDTQEDYKFLDNVKNMLKLIKEDK